LDDCLKEKLDLAVVESPVDSELEPMPKSAYNPKDSQ
jgi:hypothetical protein